MFMPTGSKARSVNLAGEVMELASSVFRRPAWMRILLDECIPRKLRYSLPEPACRIVRDAGFAGGELTGSYRLRCGISPLGYTIKRPRGAERES